MKLIKLVVLFLRQGKLSQSLGNLRWNVLLVGAKWKDDRAGTSKSFDAIAHTALAQSRRRHTR